MTYLLAKYTLLFLLTAALGFILGYWFSRRSMVDVSESFEDLREATRRSDERNWSRLWDNLQAIPQPVETDLSDVYNRLDGVTNAVSHIPKPETVNLQPVVDGISKLENDIKSIPVPAKPQPVDLSPVSGKIDALQSALRSIPRPEPVDLQPLIDRISKLENGIKAIPVPPRPQPVDLSPVSGKIDALQSALRSIPKPEPQRTVDLTPISTDIRSLEQQLKAIQQPKVVDLAPVDERLKSIEAELEKLGKRLAETAPAERTVSRPARRTSMKTSRDEPRILSAALYGKKDDLKKISGVGPKLENLLNKNGVFYFWQVSEWDSDDIRIIDERLDSFNGRIQRDNWVKQASRLRREPTAAQMPTDL